jgi:ribosome-associated protein
MEDNSTLHSVKHCLSALEDKKADDIVILDVRGKSTLTDYLVIASGTSEPHLRALRVSLERELGKSGIHLYGESKNVHSGWVVLDGFDFMVHLFVPKTREYYALEQLWKDGRKVKVKELASA